MGEILPRCKCNCSTDTDIIEQTFHSDISCNIQNTDYNPDYNSLALQNIDIIKPIEIPDEDYEFLDLVLQSTDALSSSKSVTLGGSIQQENVGFVDSVESEPVILPTTLAALQLDKSPQVELGNFLNRPVLLHTYTWADNGSLDESFEPWKDFFTTASVVKKIDNYYMIRCNLHLKFVINASPFYYSCAMASYRPLTNKLEDGPFVPCVLHGGVGLTQLTLMGRSQRPRVFLYPQSSQGAQMSLPFFYHKNWLNLTSTDDLSQMGTIYLQDLNIPLTFANSGTGSDANILIYAWATDVELAGPTLLTQSADEYGQGAISKPASAIARYANKMSDYPVIGNFATATSLAATAVSKIASMFGYTNVPVIADVHAFKNTILPQLATTEIGTPIEKLTLDTKNELSIDNRLNGVDLGDELTIASIVQRESLLDTYTWESTDAPGTLLFNSKVTPEMSLQATVGSKVSVQGTPMWMISHLFNYWRGDVIFRFRFICSNYHRGRVKISWDPIGAISATTESTNLVYTKIVDISEENDVEFSVPYTQLTSYLTIDGSVNAEYGSSPLTSTPGVHNGVLTLRVLNYQSSPLATAPIYVSVFVRGSDNLEFACPKELFNDFTQYVPQSKDIVFDTVSHYKLGVKESIANDNINLIHMGETIKSLRQLMRRTTINRRFMWQTSSATANRVLALTSIMSRLPLMPGFDPNGINTANKALSAGTASYNFCYMSPIDWINNCFIAHKGSIHWTAEVHRDVYQSSLYRFTMGRTKFVKSVPEYNSIVQTTTDTNSGNARQLLREFSEGNAGFAGITTQQTPACSVSVPFYSKYKFASNSYLIRTIGDAEDDSDTDGLILSSGTYYETAANRQNVRVNLYCSIGTDFNSVFFLNVPTYYVQATPTSST